MLTAIRRIDCVGGGKGGGKNHEDKGTVQARLDLSDSPADVGSGQILHHGIHRKKRINQGRRITFSE